MKINPSLQLMGALALLCLSIFLFAHHNSLKVPYSVSHTITEPFQTPETPSEEEGANHVEKRILVEHLSDKYRAPAPVVRQIVETAYEEGEKRNVSPLLVLALIEKESSFRPEVTNSYGAMGLMQVVPRFHREKLSDPENPDELLSPKENIRVGVEIVEEYLRAKKGNLQAALVKYSGNAREYYPRVMRFKDELRRVIQRDDRREGRGSVRDA